MKICYLIDGLRLGGKERQMVELVKGLINRSFLSPREIMVISFYQGGSLDGILKENNTERPVTVDVGTNQLVGTNFKELEKVSNDILAGNIKKGRIPELWDGKAGERIIQIFKDKL